jgi:hypothetical protein
MYLIISVEENLIFRNKILIKCYHFCHTWCNTWNIKILEAQQKTTYSSWFLTALLSMQAIYLSQNLITLC